MTVIDVDTEIASLLREFAALSEKDNPGREFGNLSLQNLKILSLLYFRPEPPTMRDVAESIGASMPSTSVMLEKLEKLDLATRKNSTEDRRIVHAELTVTGRRIIEEHVQKSHDALRTALSVLAEPDKKIVLLFFRSYIAAIKDQQDATRY